METPKENTLNGWLPIETAPTQKPVLIFVPGKLPLVARLRNNRWHSGGYAFKPTHWQPLPEPPKQ